MASDQIERLGEEVSEVEHARQSMEQTIKEFRAVIDRANHVTEERNLLRRVLAQAVLTHGGSLEVNPQFADEALKASKTKHIFCGAGRVTLEKCL